MAKYKILTPEREALLVQTLAPQFLGRQQTNLLSFADEIADQAYDQAAVQIAPLEDFRADIQSPGGAAMIGLVDAGNYFGGAGSIEDALQVAGAQIDAIVGINPTDYALLDSPIFVGNPQAPTPLTTDNDTSIATTAYVKAQGYATVDSPVFTGDPQAPTPALADNDTSIATTAWVKAQGYSSGAGAGSVTSVAVANATGITWTGSPITTSGTLTPTLSANLQSWSGIAPGTKADIASPAFTGTPTAPTAATATNTTQIATTAYVKAQGYALDSAAVHLAGTETITGAKTFSLGATFSDAISSGAATVAALNDVSRHYTAHTNGYGLSITSGAINLVAGPSGAINFVVNSNTTATANINSAGTFTYGGSEIGWRNLNRVTGGVSAGQMYATTAGFTVGSASAAGVTLYVYNNSAAAITLTQGGGMTLRLSGTATTGNRTVAPRGFATLWYNTTTECIVSGDVT